MPHARAATLPAPTAEPASSIVPPVVAHEDDLEKTIPNRPAKAPRKQPAAAASNRPNRLIAGLLVIAIVTLLVAVANLGNRYNLFADFLPPAEETAIPTAAPATVTPAFASPAAFIADIDAVLNEPDALTDAQATLATRTTQLATLAEPGSRLYRALNTWLEAGSDSLQAQIDQQAACADDAASETCISAQSAVNLQAIRADQARNLVCTLTDCPSRPAAGASEQTEE